MPSSQGFNSPQKTNRKSVLYKPYVRKFPGPAGLSHDLNFEESKGHVSNDGRPTGNSNNNLVLSSTYSDLILSKPCYQRLVEDFDLHEDNNPMSQVSLKMISKMFSRKTKRDLKVPFLGLLVSSTSQEHGVTLKLMDTTFEVYSVVHQELWSEIGEQLEVNSALALIQVPVIASCTTRPPITLFLSKKNILNLYKEGDNNQVLVKSFNRVPQVELVNNCKEWLTRLGMSANSVQVRETRMETPNLIAGTSVSNCENSKVKFEWNPDEFLSDIDFADDFSNIANNPPPHTKTVHVSQDRNGQKVRTPEPSSSSYLEEERSKSDSGFVEGSNEKISLSRTAEPKTLSPSEKLMLQEVLSGLDFDDFK